MNHRTYVKTLSQWPGLPTYQRLCMTCGWHVESDRASIARAQGVAHTKANRTRADEDYPSEMGNPAVAEEMAYNSVMCSCGNVGCIRRGTAALHQ